MKGIGAQRTQRGEHGAQHYEGIWKGCLSGQGEKGKAREVCKEKEVHHPGLTP